MQKSLSTVSVGNVGIFGRVGSVGCRDLLSVENIGVDLSFVLYELHKELNEFMGVPLDYDIVNVYFHCSFWSSLLSRGI